MIREKIACPFVEVEEDILEKVLFMVASSLQVNVLKWCLWTFKMSKLFKEP